MKTLEGRFVQAYAGEGIKSINFPGSPGVKTLPTLPLQGAWVPSLVRELRSCMLHYMAKNFKRLKKNFFKLKKMYDWLRQSNRLLPSR